MGSGIDGISVESSSTSSQTSNDNRSDLSVSFNHRAHNAQQTTNTNSASVRSQRFDLDGGLLVQNRYNRPNYNIRFSSDADRFLDLLNSKLAQSSRNSKDAVDDDDTRTKSEGPEDSESSSEDPESDQFRVNQFNVGAGGQATQFIIQQPVVNVLMAPRESDSSKRTMQRTPPIYKVHNSKPRIEILNYDTEDIL